MNNIIKNTILIIVSIFVRNQMCITQQGEDYLQRLQSGLFPQIDSADYFINEITINDSIYHYKDIDYFKKARDNYTLPYINRLCNCQYLYLYDDIVKTYNDFVDTLNNRYMVSVADTVIDIGVLQRLHILHPFEMLIEYLEICSDTLNTKDEKIHIFLNKEPNTSSVEKVFLDRNVTTNYKPYIQKLDSTKEYEVKLNILGYLWYGKNDTVNIELIKRMEDLKAFDLRLYLNAYNTICGNASSEEVVEYAFSELEKNKTEIYIDELLDFFNSVDKQYITETYLNKIMLLNSYFIETRNKEAIQQVMHLIIHNKELLCEYYIELYNNDILKDESEERLRLMKKYSKDPKVQECVSKFFEWQPK